jgi:hypothetical protein
MKRIIIKLGTVHLVGSYFSHIERKGTVASKIPKSICCNYDANFKLTVIKLAQEINKCTTKHTACLWIKLKEVLLRAATSTLKAFCRPKQRSFSATDK